MRDGRMTYKRRMVTKVPVGFTRHASGIGSTFGLVAVGPVARFKKVAPYVSGSLATQVA